MLAVLLAALAVALPADSASTGPGCPGAQTLERADIEASGAVRLAGLLRLLDAPRRQTVHGFLWPTTFGEGAPGTPAETALIVDGEPLAPDLLGLGDVERAPVDVPDLERATLCPGPHPFGGRLWEGGALYLTTRSERGLRGAVFIGNEVGDPGPFRYINGNTNIDKFGPDYSGAALWRDRQRTGTAAGARFKIRRFYATDPQVIGRTLAAAGDFPRLRLLAGEARGQTTWLGGRHRASVMASGGSTLPYLPTLGQEVPARPVWIQGSLSGDLPVGTGVSLAYRVRRSHESVRARNPAFPAGLRWSASAAHGLMELRSQRKGGHVSGGLSVDRLWFEEGEASGFVLGRAHLSAERSDRGLYGHSVLGPSGVGGGIRGWLGRDRVTVMVGAARTLPEETLDLAYWQSRGYSRFQLASVERRVADPVARDAARLRVDLNRDAGPVRLTASAGLRASRGIGIERVRFGALDGFGLPTVGTATYESDASGTDGHAGLSAGGQRGVTRLRAFADVRGALTGTRAFREAWQTAPVVRAGGRLSLHPAPSFSALTSVEVRSGTRWAAYEADGRSQLPAVVLVDAAFQKTLWGGRIRTSLLFRNLLNAPERYHPRGVALDLRLYARAVLHLP